MRIDERLPLGEYLRRSRSTPDGIAWILVCIASAVCLIDLYFGWNLVPLAKASKPDMAATMLILSPPLIFMILVSQRASSSNHYSTMAWVRGGIGITIFIVLNF